MGRRKAAGPSPSPAGEASRESGPIDEFLPLAEPLMPEVHLAVAVLEVADPAQLVELAADTALRPFLLCRLSPSAALIDPGRADELAEVLLRRGYTPKILRPRSNPS